MSPTTEETLILVKPDAVKRGLVGEVISRFERKGFELMKIRMMSLTKEQAKRFYSVHSDKAFFDELVSFISSGPIVAVVLAGKDAVATVRRMTGATKSWESPPGTLRGDLSLGLTDNVVHASDSAESFVRETEALSLGK